MPRGARGRGRGGGRPSSFVQQQNGLYPPICFKIAWNGKYHNLIKGRSMRVEVPVMDVAEARLRVDQAANFLQGKGFTFQRQNHLRTALIPFSNLNLAIRGDNKQKGVLINQWEFDEGAIKTVNFYENCVVQVVATNEHLGYMAVKHGLHQFIFATEDSPRPKKDCKQQCRGFISVDKKILADLMEALMGAICRDGGGYYNCRSTLIRFMKVFELDYGAAGHYLRW